MVPCAGLSSNRCLLLETPQPAQMAPLLALPSGPYLTLPSIHKHPRLESKRCCHRTRAGPGRPSHSPPSSSLAPAKFQQSTAVSRRWHQQRRLLPHAPHALVARESSAPAAEYLSEADAFSQYSGYIGAASTADADLWEVYDAEVIRKYFRRRPLLLARRLLQIGTSVGWWLFKRWLDGRSGKADALFEQRAGELRTILVQLGPAFVKIAQAVSSRPDVIPPAYLEQLSLLQDRIAPFSTDAALDIIEQELGVPVEVLFSEISPQPVAAASLGQVYQARLRPNGREVAVKVQRPGVKAAIALDVYILRILAGVARKAKDLNTDLQAVVDEWAGSLFKEMDYHAEARNGLRFQKLFGGLDDVRIPTMYPELTARRVLVMEWIEGERLAEVTDLRLIEVGVYCSLSQLLDSGFYHADPHPGNLLRTPDGKLAYLDFGMMGEIKQDLREALIEASVHLVNREFDALAEDFVHLGLLPPDQNTPTVATALTGVFQQAISQGVRNISFGDLSADLGKTMYSFKFRIPAYFSLVVRSLTVLEGIALSSNPNYKVLSSSYPWIARKVLTDKSPQLRSTLRALIYKDGYFRFDRLESLLTESTRPMFGSEGEEVVRTEEDSRRLLKRVLKFALSEEGEFVREALLDEVAKGIDAYSRALFDASVEAVADVLPFAVALPEPLAKEEDLTHLINLRKLAALLSEGPAQASPPGTVREPAPYEPITVLLTLEDFTTAFARAQAALQQLPRLSVVAELPLAAQQRAALLPLDLAGRLTSRVLARTIRSTIPRPGGGGGVGSSGISVARVETN